jgi:hypothetical protein
MRRWQCNEVVSSFQSCAFIAPFAGLQEVPTLTSFTFVEYPKPHSIELFGKQSAAYAFVMNLTSKFPSQRQEKNVCMLPVDLKVLAQMDASPPTALLLLMDIFFLLILQQRKRQKMFIHFFLGITIKHMV